MASSSSSRFRFLRLQGVTCLRFLTTLLTPEGDALRRAAGAGGGTGELEQIGRSNHSGFTSVDKALFGAAE